VERNRGDEVAPRIALRGGISQGMPSSALSRGCIPISPRTATPEEASPRSPRRDRLVHDSEGRGGKGVGAPAHRWRA